MERYGVLGAYLPEFARVIGQMQFDLFHIYTVDAHTIQVVRNMRRFRYKNQEQHFPIAAHIYPRLPKIELLFIAGLYHDIAKGMGGDHSELGIGIARDFCERHGLGNWDTNLVCWLVEHHLDMSSTAQRKDITDPTVIHEFAQLVQNQTRLDYLYALTVADINATNPTLWTSWRASLMSQLYVQTKKVLRHGLQSLADREDYITDAQNHALLRLLEHDLSAEEAHSIWGDVDEEYFVRETVSDIVTQTLAIREHNSEPGRTGTPLVLISDITSRREQEGATQIFIHTIRKGNSFAATVAALDALNLQIVDARIARRDNRVFDTFMVLENNDKPVGENPTRVEKIRRTISEHLSMDHLVEPKRLNRTPRLLKSFTYKTQVDTSVDEVNNLTVLEVITPDRPGLLALLANIFVEFDIQLHSAKITTLGERVEDMFYIADKHGNPVEQIDQLASRICEELDDHVQRAIA